MSLHSELNKCMVGHDCSQCIYKCFDDFPCDNFMPNDMPEFLDEVINDLIQTVLPSKSKKMRMPVCISDNPIDKMLAVLDRHSVIIINDAISEIRKGRKAYVYSIEQIRDIIRFEPGIRVKYLPEGSMYEIWLEK